MAITTQQLRKAFTGVLDKTGIGAGNNLDTSNDEAWQAFASKTIAEVVPKEERPIFAREFRSAAVATCRKNGWEFETTKDPTVSDSTTLGDLYDYLGRYVAT